jgi:hypothetical protein
MSSERHKAAVALSNRNRAGEKRNHHGVDPKTRARNAAQNKLIQAEGKRGVIVPRHIMQHVPIFSDSEQRKIDKAVDEKNSLEFQCRSIGPDHPDFKAIAAQCTDPRNIRGEFKTLISVDIDKAYSHGRRNETGTIRGMET